MERSFRIIIACSFTTSWNPTPLQCLAEAFTKHPCKGFVSTSKRSSSFSTSSAKDHRTELFQISIARSNKSLRWRKPTHAPVLILQRVASSVIFLGKLLVVPSGARYTVTRIRVLLAADTIWFRARSCHGRTDERIYFGGRRMIWRSWVHHDWIIFLGFWGRLYG